MFGKVNCPRHGESDLWIVCRHVGSGQAKNINIGSSRDAFCFECFEKKAQLTQDDVVGICEECLKDFIAALMIRARQYENIGKVIKNIENLGGRASDV